MTSFPMPDSADEPDEDEDYFDEDLEGDEDFEGDEEFEETLDEEDLKRDHPAMPGSGPESEDEWRGER